MNRAFILSTLTGLCVAGSAAAFEFPLQYTPLPGAQGVTLAGYGIKGKTVVGNCSYHITTSGSGRDPRSYTTYYNQTCTWDLKGQYVSQVTGAPATPPVLSSTNGIIVYAQDAKGDFTGVDTTRSNLGFINHPSPEYAWVTPSGGYNFLSSQQPVQVTVTVQSIGDTPLVIKQVLPVANLAKVSVASTTCPKAGVPVGSTCAITITYDPSAILGGDNPYTAYDVLSVTLKSNSGLIPLFSEHFETPIAPGG